jgi:protein-S-isoprenylcysteine O-methyltransferase Ste14
MDMSNSPSVATKAPPRPRSAVSTGVGVVGLIGLFSWVLIARYAPEIAAFLGIDWHGRGVMDGPHSALMSLAWCALPMVLWSVVVDKVHRNPSTGINWDKPRAPLSETLDISLAKLAGLWTTWAGIAVVYAVGRWHWQGSYVFAMDVLQFAALPLFILSIPYILWIDTRLNTPRDGAWHLGSWLMGQPGWDKDAIYSHLRSWGVKAFFIAFMLSIVPGGFSDLVRTPVAEVFSNPVRTAHWLIAVMFVIDIAFATVGYLLTVRPLDSHIRSANPFMAGWVAALICYPPFVLLGNGGPLDYHVNTLLWADWLQGYPVVLAIWGGVLVVLTAIYAWATVAFGLRFSNLTYRGVLTHGPYAWTKHPAYLAKNTFWWLQTLPFLVTTNTMVDGVRNTIIMACVSGVYFWRAKTEERHLGQEDPVYAEYAAWMAQHGPITSRINRLFGRRGDAAAPVPAE